MRLFYDLWYRRGTPPWVGGPRPELVRLVGDGVLPPGRAVDLGCGEGDNAIFLAQSGFRVTGVDFAASAIAKARRKASAAGVEVDFVVDDVTRLLRVEGPFDVLVDYGTLDDLSDRDRDAYVSTVRRLTRRGSRFLLWCFEWEPTRFDRVATALLPLGQVAMLPGEVKSRFARDFEVERIGGEQGARGWPRGWAAYLLSRRVAAPPAPSAPPPAEPEEIPSRP